MHQEEWRLKKKTDKSQIVLELFSLLGIAAIIYFFYKKKIFRQKRLPGKKIDIEIRYEVEKDADATFLAQSIAKIVRIVLTPLEHQIEKEGAKLILVFNGDSWEMRMRSASGPLQHSVHSLLDAKQW